MIRTIEPKDVPQVERLMENAIDEVYASEPDNVRNVLRANFTGEGLGSMIKDKQAVFIVSEIDGNIAAFIFGFLFYKAFTIYWAYSDKSYRGKGLLKEMLGWAEDKLKKDGCYKIEMYVYGKYQKFLDFSSNLGFNKGVFIEKNMFGIGIQNIYKYLVDPKKVNKEKKIKIIGEAGQGIKLLSYTLASILSQLGNEVSLNLEYDSAVRSGTVIADLIYSENKITNPIINEADILIKFKETRQWFPAKQLIIDELICGRKCIDCSVKCNAKDQFSFQTEAVQKFGSKMFINMIALGRILKYIGVNIMLINMEGLLPPKLVDKNVSAIKYGFSFRDAV